GLVELPPGRSLDPVPGGFWSDVSWLVFPAGAWVVLSPWIWGYDGVSGAVASDAVTGAAVISIALAGVFLPGLWALNVLAGLWLVTAPWLVGYGDHDGPVGLSDAVTGLLVAALAIATLSGASRSVASGGGPKAVGRIPTRRDDP